MTAKQKILLVDDNEDFVRSTTDLLEAHGYRVISANDGASGLALARQEHPDLMVLDVMMATKTEGFEVARRIPSVPELRNMPILLVTGIRSEMKLGFRLEPDTTWLPVSRIMEKPIDPAVFVAAVGELLRRRGEMDWKHGVLRLVKGILADKSGAVWSVSPEATLHEAVEMMEKHRIGCLLVVEDGKLAGVCTQWDCTRSVVLQGHPAKDTLVRGAMTSRVICVSPDDTLEECMSLVTHKRIRHLPVMEGGELVGIISIGDLVRAALAQKNFMIEQLEGYITSG
jgi:CBS domain-containing protein/CheY-like chemotaxis protein